MNDALLSGYLAQLILPSRVRAYPHRERVDIHFASPSEADQGDPQLSGILDR